MQNPFHVLIQIVLTQQTPEFLNPLSPGLTNSILANRFTTRCNGPNAPPLLPSSYFSVGYELVLINENF